jgi:hypothetical protein
VVVGGGAAVGDVEAPAALTMARKTIQQRAKKEREREMRVVWAHQVQWMGPWRCHHTHVSARRR